MIWDNDKDNTSDTAFPARHPREPTGLRQDILDEIADHLASAAEREQERGHDNEGTVRRRVLEQFGDPDAIVRKLWWDQMRETVMREWIQTGVMVVVAVVGIVGVILAARLLGGMGTANEAMREAMAQVAASNEALAKAMAEQRKGNEVLLAALSNVTGSVEPAPALQLSSIELVLRRGSESGPPAPEVEVTMEGKGPNDETMTVRAEPDAEGRARFDQLYQGSYSFEFYDPVSALGAGDRITLFAGRGAGERVIVVPDVEPRPVHLDLELPAYGRDEEQLISVQLLGTWEVDDETSGMVWRAGGTALLGHFGTWDAPSGFGESMNWPPTGSESGNPSALEPFYIAGAVSLSEARVIERQPDEASRTVQQRRPRRPPDDPAIELVPTREDDTGDYYAPANAEELINLYSSTARLFRSQERVTDNTYEPILRDAAAVLEDRFVVDAGGPLKQRMARYRDGQLFDSGPGDVEVHSNYYGDEGTAIVALLNLPESNPDDSGSDGSVYLALPVEKMQKHDVDFGLSRPDARPSSTTRPAIRRPTSMRAIEDLAGNTLAAFAIRAPWDGIAFSAYDEESEVGGISLEVDEEPFWRFSSEALEAGRTVDTLFLPLSADLLADGAAPVTGVMLRWENDTEGFYWELEFEAGHSWVLTKPLSATGDAGSDRPLNDVGDGRFHYDSIRSHSPDLIPAEQ